MRIVPNLNEIDECPNCESRGLILNHNKFGRLYKLCPVCTEEIYEGEDTYYDISESTKSKEFDCTWDEGMDTIKEVRERERKKKEDFIFEMREEINHLNWCVHDARSMTLVENIQNIFNRIIDYIEEN
jgi:hypothetical protein